MEENYKYGQFDSYNLDVYQNGELVVNLNTLKGVDFIMTRGRRLFLRIIDALIDKRVIDHINENKDLNFEIKGTSKYRSADTGKDVKVETHISKSELIYFKLPSRFDEVTEVSMTFEIFEKLDIDTETKETR